MITRVFISCIAFMYVCAQRLPVMPGDPAFRGNRQPDDLASVAMERNIIQAKTQEFDRLKSNREQRRPSVVGRFGASEISPASTRQELPRGFEQTILSGIEALLPSALNSSVNALLPSIQSAVDKAVSNALATLVQSAVTSAVKTALPGGIGQATSQSATDPSVCPPACKPSWMKMITTMLGGPINSNAHSMCQFKSIFPECSITSSGSSCSTSPGAMVTCCPLRCVKELNTCWQGTTTQNVCMPQMFKMTGKLINDVLTAMV